MISNKRKYREHIKELKRKGMMAARKVWRLGEKICRNDFKRKWILFKYLMQSHGIWDENLGMEKSREVGKDYVGLCKINFWFGFLHSKVFITRKLKMNKLRVGWDIRAKKYEEKVKIGIASKIIKECWQEKEQYGWKNRYGKERKLLQ